jgi:transcription antitermination factor NusG
MPTTPSYWGVIRSEPQREHVAERFLQLAKFEVYYPCIAVAGRKRPAPLFPSYLFARFNGVWHEARRTPGVLALVMSDGQPARIADEIVESIKMRQDSDGLIRLRQPEPPSFRRGDAVRITKGPLADRLGIFEHMSGAERVAVLLSLLGRTVTVRLPSSDIEEVGVRGSAR